MKAIPCRQCILINIQHTVEINQLQLVALLELLNKELSEREGSLRKDKEFWETTWHYHAISKKLNNAIDKRRQERCQEESKNITKQSELPIKKN